MARQGISNQNINLNEPFQERRNSNIRRSIQDNQTIGAIVPELGGHSVSPVNMQSQPLRGAITSQVSLGSDNSEFDFSFLPPQSVILASP
jgi:hypothetical protein